MAVTLPTVLSWGGCFCASSLAWGFSFFHIFFFFTNLVSGCPAESHWSSICNYSDDPLYHLLAVQQPRGFFPLPASPAQIPVW